MNEEQIKVGTIPLTVWTPDENLCGVVLLGHGLGVARFHVADRYVARQLVDNHRIAVIVPEIPLHGERSDPEATDLTEAWRAFWADGGWRRLGDEWASHVAYSSERFPDVPLGYFGLSLGTQYGVPFIAQHSAVSAAVVGLFGTQPTPRSRLLNHFAPQVTCPLLFVRQTEDEIHSAETTQHLFDSLGSSRKVLENNPGRHGDVPTAALDRAAQFLATQLIGRQG